jgi:TonB family protein
MGRMFLWLGCVATLLLAQPAPLIVPPHIQEQRLIRRVPPRYPPEARRSRLQGIVRLNALIDEEGVVRRLGFANGHPMLVQAAMDAAYQWRYRPAYRNGAPVAVISRIAIVFRLDERRWQPRLPPHQLQRRLAFGPEIEQFQRLDALRLAAVGEV